MPRLNNFYGFPACGRASLNSILALSKLRMLLNSCVFGAAVFSLAACQGGGDGTDNSGMNSSPDTTTNSSGNPATMADITDVVLVTGQSNALGADTGYDAAIDTPVDRAYAYTSEGWQIADLNQIWDLNWHPRNDPATDPSNNFAFHFARKVALRRPEKVVGFILVTAPGEAIDHWDGGGEFFLKITDRVSAALNELPSKSSIDGILWHQGESDWADNDYYSNKLSTLISNFRSESWYGFNKPFICGETVEAPVNRRLMALNSDNDRWTGCVESDGLSTILDNLHFSAEGLRTLGTRYATKYLQMTE
ncbi:hypothetical protein AB833_25580 [Chromatiales bacterium (ex Bugula neritina AB1)]|nr:hypothetical protein AB833_25580 [Chromatiales bacterium (ex Bugula neritina AB1)]